MIAGDLDVSYIVINPCVVFGTTYVSVKSAKLFVLQLIWLPSWISSTQSCQFEVDPGRGSIIMR